MIHARHSTHTPAPPPHGPAGSVRTVQTWLRADASGAMLTRSGGPSLHVAGPALGTTHPWPADALLVGAVEAGIRADFLALAASEKLEVAFYESTALGRWTEGERGPELLDLDVHPRIGVHRATDAALARSLFDEVAAGCTAARALRAPIALRPTVEIWSARRPPPGGAAPA
ncbi:MAG TPA: hypothetical protein VK454_05320 [Myxococcaceae bacterium]|nr:hypothetical protein [Myxococcaceae bacterium]